MEIGKVAVQSQTRLARYELDEIIPLIGTVNGKHPFRVEDRLVPVRLGGRRMALLKRCQKCACCGLTGTHFWLETNGHFSPHFNLYGLDPHGREVMLTCDHILPRAKGGTLNGNNVQLLCLPCNREKKDDMITLEELRARREVRVHSDYRTGEWVRRGEQFGQIYKLSRSTARVRLWCPCMSDGVSAATWKYADFERVDDFALVKLREVHGGCGSGPAYGNGRAETRAYCAHLQRPANRFWVPKIVTEESREGRSGDARQQPDAGRPVDPAGSRAEGGLGRVHVARLGDHG